MLDGIGIVGDETDRLDRPRDRTPRGCCRSDSQVDRNPRIDAYDSRVGTVFAGIHRHEVHTHRRFARFVTTIVRIHRRDPVQDLTGTIVIRRCIAGRAVVHVAADEYAGNERQTKTCSNYQKLLHREIPPRLASTA